MSDFAQMVGEWVCEDELRRQRDQVRAVRLLVGWCVAVGVVLGLVAGFGLLGLRAAVAA